MASMRTIPHPSEGPEINGDFDIDDGVESKRGGQVGGRARWLPLDEQRLKPYVKENKDLAVDCWQTRLN